MKRHEQYTKDTMPPHVWQILVDARQQALRGDPRAWYRALRQYCGYTTGSSLGAMMELRVDASRRSETRVDATREGHQ